MEGLSAGKLLTGERSMRELTSTEMAQVVGGHGQARGLHLLAPGTAVDRDVALAHLATVQGELDALNVQEQIWTSLSHS